MNVGIFLLKYLFRIPSPPKESFGMEANVCSILLHTFENFVFNLESQRVLAVEAECRSNHNRLTVFLTAGKYSFDPMVDHANMCLVHQGQLGSIFLACLNKNSNTLTSPLITFF